MKDWKQNERHPMNKFKNGREAGECNPVVGTIGGKVIAGALQINPDTTKPGTGFVHMQELTGTTTPVSTTVCHEVNIADLFHAADALAMIEKIESLEQSSIEAKTAKAE
jgi:hypothetical protein